MYSAIAALDFHVNPDLDLAEVGRCHHLIRSGGGGGGGRAGGGGRDRRGAGSSEPKGTRSDGGDPVTAREVLSVTSFHHA